MKKILGLFVLFSIVLTSCKAQKSASEYTLMIKEHQEKYMQDFIKNERAPLRENDLEHVYFYDADESFRVNCSFEKAKGPKPFKMATYSGITKDYILYGTVTCPLEGENVSLELYQSLKSITSPLHRDALFLPFKDETNDVGSYGGGRYMDMSTKDISDGKIEIDFNKAYNPWCAYSDGYNCPIPPVVNHMSLAITAGEKMYKGERKQRKED